MRFFGLGAQVMQKLGVSTQLLAGADIYPALERGVIDATEFSMPNMDIDLGFHQVAKFNYYPGWHQQSSIGELLMNKAAFEALVDQNQAILEASCGWNIYVNYAETEAKNPDGDEQDARGIRRHQRALDRRGARRVREGLERGRWRSSRRRTRTSSGSPTATTRSVRSTRPGATPRPSSRPT